MKTKFFLAPLMAAAAALALATAPALANKPVNFTVSGSVTDTPTGAQITVNGHTYRIQSGSSAATEATEVQTGDSVQLRLNGPPDSASTEVVAIHATHNQ